MITLSYDSTNESGYLKSVQVQFEECPDHLFLDKLNTFLELVGYPTVRFVKEEELEGDPEARVYTNINLNSESGAV